MLHHELLALQLRTQAKNVLVCDQSANAWCAASMVDLPNPAGDILERALRSRGPGKMRIGVRVSHADVDTAPYYLAESFGGIYLVLLWFWEPFDPALQQGHVRRALPRIARLTISLPPPDGPQRNAAVIPLRRA